MTVAEKTAVMTVVVVKARMTRPVPPSGRGHAPKKHRLPHAVLRGWAWILAGIAFFIPLSVFGVAPKPAGAMNSAKPDPVQPRIIHQIRRIIVVHHIPAAQPSVVYVGGTSSSSSSGGGGGYRPPPVTSTGGS